MDHRQPSTGRLGEWIRGRSPKGVVLGLILIAVPVLIIVIALRSGPDLNRAQDGELVGLRPAMVALIEVEIDQAEAEDSLPSILALIERQSGVARAVGDGRDGGYVVYVTVDDVQRVDRVATRLVGTVEDRLGDDLIQVTIGGSGPFRQAVDSGYARSILMVVLAGLVGAIYLAWRYGRRSGLITGLAAVVTIPMAGSLGASLVDGHEPSLGTSVLPGALTAMLVVLVGAAHCVRSLKRSTTEVQTDETGETLVDGADQVWSVIGEVAPKLATIPAVLTVVAALVEATVEPITGLTPMALGAAVAVLLVLAIVPVCLVASEAITRSGPGREWGRGERLDEAVARSDGRSFGLVALSVFGLLLAVLTLFALRQWTAGPLSATDLEPSDLGFIDGSRGPGSATEVYRADRFLESQGADPTESLIIVPADEATGSELEAWAAEVAALPSIAWVDLGTRRLADGQSFDIDPEETLLDLDRIGSSIGGVEADADRVALVVPADRPDDGQVPLVDQIRATSIGAEAPVLGPSSGSGTSLPTSAVVVVILALALVSALAVRLVTRAGSSAITVGLLGLLEIGSVAGILALAMPGGSPAELMIGVALVGASLLAVSIDSISDLIDDPRSRGRGQAVDATIAHGCIIVAGLAMLIFSRAGGGPFTDRFGLALALAGLVVAVAGLIVLRPALVTEGWQYQILARPLRIYANSGLARRELVEGESDTRWKPIVEGLVQAEHALQESSETAPQVGGRDSSELADVFLDQSPIHRQATEAASTMTEAELTVRGAPPTVVSVAEVANHHVTKLHVTTDHPMRRLVHSSGRVIGKRSAQRRAGVLWLSQGGDGRWRVLESIERDAIPMPTEKANADR